MTARTPTLTVAPASFRAWLGIVFLFVVFGFFVFVLIGASPRGNDYEAKRAAVRTEKLKSTMEEMNKDLHTYGWVDKAKGVARIPIDRAMQLTLADLAQKKPTAAGPIATPAPAATPSASPSTPATAPAAGQPKEGEVPSAATSNPPGAPAGTQPSASPAASLAASAKAPAQPTPVTSPVSASPLPVPGKSPQ